MSSRKPGTLVILNLLIAALTFSAVSAFAATSQVQNSNPFYSESFKNKDSRELLAGCKLLDVTSNVDGVWVSRQRGALAQSIFHGLPPREQQEFKAEFNGLARATAAQMTEPGAWKERTRANFQLSEGIRLRKWQSIATDLASAKSGRTLARAGSK